MKLTYRRCGDYYLPNIGIPAEDMCPLGKYGRMRLRYLREHALRVHGHDARLMKLFVMGGGGCLVKHFGKYDPSAVVFVDDLHASAKGYEYMAQGVIWRNERLAREAGD